MKNYKNMEVIIIDQDGKSYTRRAGDTRHEAKYNIKFFKKNYKTELLGKKTMVAYL